ncbi:hypothetical protein QFC21_000677 [Naganishia friedmannii]|uniref:Uncharacterized protein n=1 Tax=Naganishia friedmannii TaxID=89922 RepID=A0ACC2WD00_9TREE|nr:hypothetical protein QFC21_000677 [Naganishia friedmannii]
MRCTRLVHAARPTAEGVFGKFELLRPPKIRKSTASGATTTAYLPPLPVPSRIIRPSYVPVNLFTRKTNDEVLAEAPPDDLEGYHGEAGVGNSQTGVIPLGGMEERGVRYSGALVAEILDQVRALVQYSHIYARPLHPTDIINIDVTVFASLPHDLASDYAAHPVAFHGDSSMTICLPEVDEQGRELVDITQEALDIGIKQCGPGRKFREIGCAIEAYVRQYGYSVNQQFTGHGIGQRFHTAPWILHHGTTACARILIIVVPETDALSPLAFRISQRTTNQELWNQGIVSQ